MGISISNISFSRDNLNDSDIEFLSVWIERIEDKNENMKLKILMLSKEADEIQEENNNNTNNDNDNDNNAFKNDYLLDNASLEDLDLASNHREEFEIMKLIEMICNFTIHDVDISRLTIN